ncbi:MAG: glycoside hydrolase/phage tail family protein [Pseudomonadota bacterium]
MAQLMLTAGRSALNAALPALVDQARTSVFAPDRDPGPRLDGLELQTSTEGAPIPLTFGRVRLAGQVIWAGDFVENARTERSGGKGGSGVTHYEYAVSFAVGLCEGPIQQIGRVWANGELLDPTSLVMRVHLGDEDQGPDPAIEADEATGATPAFKGLAYVVFEDFPLDAYGARIPNLSFEVYRQPLGSGGLEAMLTGVSLIPASGEFAYTLEPVTREVGPGRDLPENAHAGANAANVSVALEQLETALPHCVSVSLVSSWFADGLDCANCSIRPKVESRSKVTRPAHWSVAGLSREQAEEVSWVDDAPAYGGTPDDASVIALIQSLKSRGYAVTLHPFVLVDAEGFPWRGRIGAFPPPGEAGSPDRSVAARQGVETFVGTAQASHFSLDGEKVVYSGPAEWSFARFLLHHAMLAKAAGGVEAFLIGSEMRALSFLRDETGHPFVEELRRLAAEVRTILGPNVKLSYGADWSEYSGFSPPETPGDRVFHLDPFWSDPAVDFVGIDWYAPLSDWRDGFDHADALAGAASIHSRDYLTANVEGGEGYDWYYASDADREVQQRSAIEDGAHGEPWVWRYKDIRSWWANAHHDRVDGVRLDEPTGWLAQSKPIRFTEIGCPAVDKGANQPNVFVDPKSSESALPHHSSGERDDLIQRRYLETIWAYWNMSEGGNPTSSVYGGAMLDLDHSTAWTWDARPFPEFPAREDIWTDTGNWRLGHWLNGRVGVASLAAIVLELCERAGLANADVSALEGLVTGYRIDQVRSARESLAELSSIFRFDLLDGASGPVFRMRDRHEIDCEQIEEPVRSDGELVRVERVALVDRAEELRIGFIADDESYNPSAAYARGLEGQLNGLVQRRAHLVCDIEQAEIWARAGLADLRAGETRIALRAPPSLIGLQVGDLVGRAAEAETGPWRVASADGIAARDFVLERASAVRIPAVVAVSAPSLAEVSPPPARALLHILDLPAMPNAVTERGGPLVAAYAAPWSELEVYVGASAETATLRTTIPAPATVGVLTSSLSPAGEGRWMHDAALEIEVFHGSFSSAGRLAVLGGANQIAVQGVEGWEIISFLRAEEIEPARWRLSGLLRRIGGGPPVDAGPGAGVVALDRAVKPLPMHAYEFGAQLEIFATPLGASLTAVNTARTDYQYDGLELQPLSPVHLRALTNDEGLQLSWVRRTRLGGDGWNLLEAPLSEQDERYQVRLLDPLGAVLSQDEVAQPGWHIAPAALNMLVPDGLSGCSLDVAQLSDLTGAGRPARLVFA